MNRRFINKFALYNPIIKLNPYIKYIVEYIYCKRWRNRNI